ncbi:MAG: amidohydrolase family protein, partial [Deltaproteobacteria bacterium]|nr:amidohydrolase family protein [Deltaproteobacteria bacterium]
MPSDPECIVRRVGDTLHLPGLATSHSHAFQRALRGLAQRHGATASREDFWSWRGLMYRLAEQLTPEDVFALSRFAFAELALAGVTAVGEFHYLAHQPDGTPYDDRLELADAVVRAAREIGLRITLLRVLYGRAAAGRAPEGAQRRFCDRRVEDGLMDVEALLARYGQDACVHVGVAPHSVRAVPREWLGEAARFSEAHDLPLHAHVSEQRAELDACRAEHGVTPIRLLSEEAALSTRFVAVHATHLEAGEA